MKSTAGTAAAPTPVTRRLTFATIASVLSVVAFQGVAQGAIPATGFAQPYAGTPKYEKYAPTEVTSVRQVNRPLGSKAADRIARKLGLNKRQVFTYTSEVVYGTKAQQQSGVAQLVPNQKGARSSTVGMSMAPSIWIVNFAPRLAGLRRHQVPVA